MAVRKARKDQKSKFKFVEMFAIQDEEDLDKVDSPKYVTTRFFGTKLLHQIARVINEEYEEETPEVEKVNKDGTVVYKKVKKNREKMGEKGGWIERMENLSQDGECWVGDKAIVCGRAYVSDNAQVRDRAEVGDNARVAEDAEVQGKAGVNESAYVHGMALVGGDDRIAVSGSAEVLGRVMEKSIAKDRAYVGEDVELMGKAKVEEHGIVLAGYLRDDSVVTGNAIVAAGYYDENDRPMVTESSEVGGEVIMAGGSAEGSRVAGLAVVESANVKQSTIEGQPNLVNMGGGELKVESSAIKGNFIEWDDNDGRGAGGSIKGCSISGNVMHSHGARVVDSTIGGNTRWAGEVRECGISNAIRTTSQGSAGSTAITNCTVQGGVVETRLTNSTMIRGYLRNTNGVSNAWVLGVIAGSQRVTGTQVSGVVRGKVSGGSVDGVVVGESTGGDVAHAALKNFANYPSALVKLSNGGGAHGLVICSPGGVDSAVSYLETQMSRMEQESADMEKELAEQAAEAEANGKAADDIRKKQQEAADKTKEKLEAAKKKQEEAKKAEEEEEKRQAEAEAKAAEEERKRQERVDKIISDYEGNGIPDKGGRQSVRNKGDTGSAMYGI
jgi:flagellar biosynthesis GTPase FlhF